MAFLTLATSALQAAPDWTKILAPPESPPVVPTPRAGVEWLTDWRQGLALAKQENRPLFVALRCLPCKQCADFDKDVLEGGPGLTPVLKQFVTVRLTSAGDIDLRLFPVAGYQDFDISWWGYLFSPEGHLYSVFGGRDDASESTLIPSAALTNTLKRVLDHHYDPRFPHPAVDGPAPDISGKPDLPADLPSYDSWKKRYYHANEANGGACLHCHQVGDVLRQPSIDNGTFDKTRDLDVWPLPENVGITLGRDHGLRITGVTPNSPAANAGLQPGDTLAAAGDRKLFGQADFRAVLHRAPHGPSKIPVQIHRGETLLPVTLETTPGWRKTTLFWRASASGGHYAPGPGFFPLKISTAKRKKFNIPATTMAIEPFMGKNAAGRPSYQAGLRPDDIVTAVDGESPDKVGRDFLTWFRLRYDFGDNATFTAVNPQGQTRKITFELK